MVFNDDIVIKKGIDEQGKAIGKKEINWYQFISKLHFENIPRIISYAPLTMERIHGHNIFELDCLVRSQKEIILKNIVNTLQHLHDSVPKIPADINDLSEAYINKTFSRLDKIKTLVPFADRDFIRINGQYYRNIYAWKEEVISRIKSYFPTEFSVIHGDCTFSNIMYDTFAQKIILIDPRGYFGKTQVYGDVDYDWAKLYYSINGNYDQFNRKKYSLCIAENEIELTIKSTDWEDIENTFFDLIPGINRRKIKLLHALIWLSLTTYAWDDFDSICGAFYNGIIKLGEAME